MLCCLTAATSSVRSKQKYLNRTNCRNERVTLNNNEQNIEDCLVCAKEVVKKFVNVQLSSQIPVANFNDMSYNYATNLLTLGLLWYGYHDAIKEGDGNRILL